jgi:hypothetical protein
MDPDAVLAEIRELLEEGNSDEAGLSFMQLDDWLSNGGSLPVAWMGEQG